MTTEMDNIRKWAKRLQASWRLVERYCEDFATDDFRLVFKHTDGRLVEISVTKPQFDIFGPDQTTGHSSINEGETNA